MKKAFTLIELLVVIAIIAILAAILFPVFAQAKLAAKKTQTLSNVKQMGTGIAIYISDADDNYPLACSVRADGSYRWSTVHPTPPASIGSGWDDPVIVQQVNVEWANSIQPYIKSWGLYGSPTAHTVTLPGEVFSTIAGAPKPADIALTMNGLFSGYSGSAVESPSLVPLLWTGQGNLMLKGRSGANPALWCDGPGVNGVATGCRFNPSGPAQSNSTVASGGFQEATFGYDTFDASYNVWNYGNSPNDGGAAFVRADTSAKVQRVGTAADPQFHSTASTDPFAIVGADPDNGGGMGAAFSYWGSSQGDCSADLANDNGTFQYNCFFRPDRTK